MGILRIDEILKEKGMSNSDFAEKIGVTPTMASGIKSGRTSPSFDRLVEISKVLDVDVRELFKPTTGGSILNGFVEYNGEVFKILTSKDLESLLLKIDNKK